MDQKLPYWGATFTDVKGSGKQRRVEVRAKNKEEAFTKLLALKKPEETMSEPIEAVGG